MILYKLNSIWLSVSYHIHIIKLQYAFHAL